MGLWKDYKEYFCNDSSFHRFFLRVNIVSNLILMLLLGLCAFGVWQYNIIHSIGFMICIVPLLWILKLQVFDE